MDIGEDSAQEQTAGIASVTALAAIADDYGSASSTPVGSQSNSNSLLETSKQIVLP